MTVDIAAANHAVIAGGGDGAGNFQGGVQNGGDLGVVDTHVGDQTHHFAVFRHGAHIPLNAGVGTPVDGQGVFPVAGVPADDVGIHQLVVLMGFQQFHALAQALVLTGDGFGLTGGVLHFGNLLFQYLVFRRQGLIAEHIAVVFFRGGGQGGGSGPEGGQHALHRQIQRIPVGNAAENGKHNGQNQGRHQNNGDFTGEQVSHWVSSMISGAIFRSTCPRRHRGSPMTL